MTSSTYSTGGHCVMSQGLRELGSIRLFRRSDSRLVSRSSLGCVKAGRTGSNEQNTYGVGKQTPSVSSFELTKANGAGHTEGSKRSNGGVTEVFQGYRRCI